MNSTKVFVSITLTFISFWVNGQITSKKNFTEAQIIPNNVAYGKPTVGGFAGKIIKVTNLNSGGPGSFKAALRSKGPRIVIFEVGGIIDLNKTNLTITEPFLSVAGQTAPSPGITIIKGGISIKTHDVIIQHIRVRPGDAGQTTKAGYDPDGISTYGGNAYNIIIDHCSVTWGIDENLTASGGRSGSKSTSHNITFSNNIVAEGLNKSSHPKGNHSMGTLIHDFAQDIAIVGNLYSSNNQRNPFFKAFTKGVVINNLIYNPGSRAIHMSWSNEELAHLSYAPKNGQVSIVGNVMYAGINTKKGLALVSGKGDAYLEDNIVKLTKNGEGPMLSGAIQILKKAPSWPGDFIALPSKSVVNYIVEHAGARPKDRDVIDKRIVEDFLQLKGSIIDSQNDVGGYPQYKSTYRKLEIPKKGVEKWLAKFSAEVE